MVFHLVRGRTYPLQQQNGEVTNATAPGRGSFEYNGKMAVRLIALDIDGTLLDSRWQLPEANRAAIAEAARTKRLASGVANHPAES